MPVLQYSLDVMRSGEGVNVHDKLQKVKTKNQRGIGERHMEQAEAEADFVSHPKETENFVPGRKTLSLETSFTCISAPLWKFMKLTCENFSLFWQYWCQQLLHSFICTAQATVDLKSAPALFVIMVQY